MSESFSPLTLSEEAMTAVREAMAASGRAKVLRVAFVYGCGGAGYRLSLEHTPQEGDRIFHLDQLTLSMDAMAADELSGGVITCQEGDDGPELTLDHPSAVGAPMCGW